MSPPLLIWLGLVGLTAGGMLVALRRGLPQLPARHLSIYLAGMALLWGLIGAQPWQDTLAAPGPYYVLMRALAAAVLPGLPAHQVWGLATWIVGATQAIGLWSGHRRIAQTAYALAAGWWWSILMMVSLLPGALVFATGIYGGYMLACAWVAAWHSGERA